MRIGTTLRRVQGGGLEAGSVLGERYRLRRLIGEGGMGWVWEATDVTTDRPVALKLLKSAKDEDRKRFQRELRAAAAIRHPNVIAVHDFVELPDGMLVIVMDLLEGETLASILARDRRIPLSELAAILLPVLAALEAAHALGIIHRDVKPDNIYLCASDSPVRVLDFGIAKLTAEEGLAARTLALTGTGAMVGTPYYMSPEQVFADKDLDPRADIWSLGIVMYECLTGLRPTEADTLGRVLKRIMAAEFDPITIHCADLPDDVASLVARMLAADPEDRPRDLDEVRTVLTRHAGEIRRRVAPAPKPAPVEDEERDLARIDTNRGVSVAPPRSLPARSPLVIGGALVAIGLIASAVFLRGQADADKPSREPVSSAAFTGSDPPPSASVIAPDPPAVAALPAPVAPPATTGAPVVAKNAPGAVRAAPRAPVVPTPSCDVGEVASEGHCCPRGHVWRAGRCERPLATTF